MKMKVLLNRTSIERYRFLSSPRKFFSQPISIEEKLKQEKVEDHETVRVKSEQLARIIEKSKHFILS